VRVKGMAVGDLMFETEGFSKSQISTAMNVMLLTIS
jgi:hypothetical protein